MNYFKMAADSCGTTKYCAAPLKETVKTRFFKSNEIYKMPAGAGASGGMSNYGAAHVKNTLKKRFPRTKEIFQDTGDIGGIHNYGVPLSTNTMMEKIFQ
jgi:hypothetical protein